MNRKNFCQAQSQLQPQLQFGTELALVSVDPPTPTRESLFQLSPISNFKEALTEIQLQLF